MARWDRPALFARAPADRNPLRAHLCRRVRRLPLQRRSPVHSAHYTELSVPGYVCDSTPHLTAIAW